MIGLLKKDIMLIIKNFKLVYLIAVLPPVLVSVSNPHYFIFIISMTLSVTIAMQTSITLELDERVRWERIVMAMPINVKSVAMSKYLLTMILALFDCGLVSAILSIYYGSVILFYGITSAIVVIMYNMIIIPVSYRFGTGVSRYFLILFISIPILVIYIFKMFHINISVEIFKLNIYVLYAMLGFVVVVGVLVSIHATVRVLKRRT